MTACTHALRLFCLWAVWLTCPCDKGHAGEAVPLWPGKPPQFLEGAPAETVDGHGSIRNVTVPSITTFLPPADKRTGMAIIVCAGGGYERWTGRRT